LRQQDGAQVGSAILPLAADLCQRGIGSVGTRILGEKRGYAVEMVDIISDQRGTSRHILDV
jgi:hypothetical protein